MNLWSKIALCCSALFSTRYAADRNTRCLPGLSSSQGRTSGMGDARIVAKPPSIEGPLWGERLQLPQLRWTCMGKVSPLRIMRILWPARRTESTVSQVSGDYSSSAPVITSARSRNAVQFRSLISEQVRDDDVAGNELCKACSKGLHRNCNRPTPLFTSSLHAAHRRSATETYACCDRKEVWTQITPDWLDART